MADAIRNGSDVFIFGEYGETSGNSIEKLGNLNLQMEGVLAIRFFG